MVVVTLPGAAIVIAGSVGWILLVMKTFLTREVMRDDFPVPNGIFGGQKLLVADVLIGDLPSSPHTTIRTVSAIPTRGGWNE